jgi:hypothetical protein
MKNEKTPKAEQFQVRTTKDIKDQLETLKGSKNYSELMEFFIALSNSKTAMGIQKAEQLLLSWLHLGHTKEITSTSIRTYSNINKVTADKLTDMYSVEIEKFNNDLKAKKLKESNNNLKTEKPKK